MNSQDDWKELFSEIRVFAKWAVSSLLDGGFLVLWVFIQWIVNDRVIVNLPLYGIDSWVLGIFQIIFAVSTLAPVLIYITVDITKMFLRAKRAIQHEVNLGKQTEQSNE